MTPRCMFCGRFVSGEHDCPNRLFDLSVEDTLHDLQLAADKHQRAQRIGKDLWRVTSSTPGQWYAVYREGKRLLCTCKGYAVRRHCSHSTMVHCLALRNRIPPAARRAQLLLSTNWAAGAYEYLPKEVV